MPNTNPFLVETEPFYNRALVWNWVEKSWTIKDLNDISYIAEGYITPKIPVVDSWDSDSGSWNDDRTRWNGEFQSSPISESLLMANYGEQKFYGLEYTSGTNLWKPPSRVARIGIDFNNDRRFKQISRIVPHLRGETPVKITVFVSDKEQTSPTIGQEVWFNPSIDHDVDVNCVGRYIGLQFYCDGLFTLEGYTIEWTPLGDF